MPNNKLSLISPDNRLTHRARLLDIVSRLNDAVDQIINSPVITSTGIKEEDFKAVVTEHGIYLQIPEDGLSGSVQLLFIAENFLKVRDKIHCDFQINLYSPTFNLPDEFVPYEKFFGWDTINYRMLIKIQER